MLRRRKLIQTQYLILLKRRNQIFGFFLFIILLSPVNIIIFIINSQETFKKQMASVSRK